jgi:hypothetical protein
MIAVASALVALGCDDGESTSSGTDAAMGGAGGGEGGTGGAVGGTGGGEGGTGGAVGGAGGEGGTGGGEGGTGGMEPEGAAFGEECRRPDDCDSDSADWPDCINADCAGGDCTIPGLDGSIGYCTRTCVEDFTCENAGDGPYGTEFACLSDGVSGVCSPGSNQRCDGPGNGMCDDDGEVCVFQLVFAADATYGATCQPPHPNGLPLGSVCGEGADCANGNCMFGVCRAFCDPGAEANLCDAEAEQCFDNLPLSSDGSISLDMCLPKYCEADADCPNDLVCQVALDFAGDPYIVGFCAPPGEDTVGAGEQCDEDSNVCDVICLGEGASSYCAHMCDDDSDCVDGTCSIITFGLGDDGSAPAQLCVSATGSGRACTSNTDCAADGDIPQEACEYIVRGNIDGGRPQGDQFAEGRCAAIPEGAVAFGEPCGEDAPCESEGLCLTAGNTSFCSAACSATSDCPEGAACGGLQLTQDGLTAGICSPDGGSIAACTADADCPVDSEYCAYNSFPGPDGRVIELVCLEGRDGGANAGQDCGQDAECRSDTCLARSQRIAAPGYCRGVCTDDAQCSEDGSITCERTLLDTGADVEDPADDIHGGFCVPAGLCNVCDHRGTRPCGGEYDCSRVRFPQAGADDRFGNACLPTCDGPGGACPDAHNCALALDDDGQEMAGRFVCQPEAPNDTCTDARPRR